MKDTIALPDGILLDGDRAIYLRSEDLLAIADLHLGYEASLQAEHVAIPRFQLDTMLPRLERLLARYGPETVVINGDMKHEFGRNRPQEWDEVEAVLDLLAGAGCDVVAVRGNHDNYLRTILARREIPLVDSFAPPGGDVLFLHGHTDLDTAAMRIFGHEHPVIRLRDDVGARLTLPCFLHDTANRILIMPAFSPLASGTDVLAPEETFMSPALRGLDMAGARVYGVQDGLIDLGTVGRLRDFGDWPDRREMRHRIHGMNGKRNER